MKNNSSIGDARSPQSGFPRQNPTAAPPSR
jgi:hypothetical protein